MSVINYINNLEPAILMYALNYDLRTFGKNENNENNENNYM